MSILSYGWINTARLWIYDSSSNLRGNTTPHKNSNNKARAPAEQHQQNRRSHNRKHQKVPCNIFKCGWTWCGFDILPHHIHDNSSEIHLLLLLLPLPLRPPIFFFSPHIVSEKNKTKRKVEKKEKAEVEAEESRRKQKKNVEEKPNTNLLDVDSQFSILYWLYGWMDGCYHIGGNEWSSRKSVLLSVTTSDEEERWRLRIREKANKNNEISIHIHTHLQYAYKKLFNNWFKH